MAKMKNLENCRIILHSPKTGQTLAETSVASYDSGRRLLHVRADELASLSGQPVSALVFGNAMLYEVFGVLTNRVISNEREITLYRESEINNRKGVRYNVDMPAIITSITHYRNNIPVSQTTAYTAHIINMSSVGILLQAPAGNINVDDVIKITAIKSLLRLRLECKVIRLQDCNIQSDWFGCTILSIKNE